MVDLWWCCLADNSTLTLDAEYESCQETWLLDTLSVIKGDCQMTQRFCKQKMQIHCVHVVQDLHLAQSNQINLADQVARTKKRWTPLDSRKNAPDNWQHHYFFYNINQHPMDSHGWSMKLTSINHYFITITHDFPISISIPWNSRCQCPEVAPPMEAGCLLPSMLGSRHRRGGGR